MEEPPKRSVLDVINTLEANNICRLIYFAGIESRQQVLTFFNEYSTNSFFDRVTGLLLVYPTSVVHLVEADEETIYTTCLDFIINRENGLAVCRCLPVHTTTTGRLFPRWFMREINPTNDCAVTEFTDVTEMKIFYFRLVDRLYKFYFELRSNTKNIEELKDKLDALSRENPGASIPSENLIKSLLKSTRGFELSDITENYWTGMREKEDIIWPIPDIGEPSISP
ncbi:uncharacterized protein C7orf62-like [Fopius arisanus]|uniref:Uncharacterized protein C7orf62-like n=1 Tax=Fopius arisanus TaxID=64838 RepID=A0A9R1TKX9_9HYME|nr:PREDICTED: uncharacterized protein C7orf62-like [Fopius arisanus]